METFVTEALAMQLQGQEKANVICHLMTGQFIVSECTGEDDYVIFVEPHKRDNGSYFVHIVSRKDVIEDKGRIICEKTISDIVIVTTRLHKKATKKWSMKKERVSSSPVVQEVKYRVVHLHRQAVSVKFAPTQRKALVSTGKGDVMIHCITKDVDLSFLSNAISVISKLYMDKHEERGQELKERLFNEIVQTMVVPLVVFDIRNLEEEIDPKKMICTYCNDAFCTLIDSTKTRLETSPQDQRYEDEQHQPFANFLSNSDIQKCIENVMKHTQDRKLSGPQTKKRLLSESKSGSLGEIDEHLLELEYGDELFPKSHYEIHVYRVNGTRIGMLVRDISEKIRHLELIEQASKAKTEFLAHMNHQIRSPLNSIDGNLQLLVRTEPLTDRQKDLIHRMRLSETALMSLLQEVLDYAKLEQHKMKLHNETFSLRHCLQATIDVMQAAASIKKVNLDYDLGIDVPALVVGDSWRLQQVLVNLVSNAINYTEEGSITVNVSKVNEEEELRFDVTDTGVGIDEETKEQLFIPWVQSSVLGPRSRKGTGLGLAICKELCQLMGGKIWLESTLQQQIQLPLMKEPSSTRTTIERCGSTFSFQIPLKSAEDKETLNMATKEMATIKGKQVLIMYRDEPLRKLMVKTMLGWGIRPTTCSSIEEAIDFINAGCEFDVAVMGDLCTSCKDKDTILDDEDKVIRLAHWITANQPMLPMVGIGNSISAHDDECVRLFRKVVEQPVKVESFFHIFVNLFSASRSSTPKSNRKQSLVGAVKQSQLKCLVVEDVAENRVVLVEMLNYLGYKNIDIAENGQDMLNKLEKSDSTYDIVFLDILMPVMNGIDAMKVYRKTRPLGTKPFIVAVTATNIISDDPVCYKEAGMDAFIQKPIKFNDIKALLDVIESQ